MISRQKKKADSAPAKTQASPIAKKSSTPFSCVNNITPDQKRPWRFYSEEAVKAWNEEGDMILKGWEEAKEVYGGEPIEIIYMAGYIQRAIDEEGLDR